MKLIPVKDFTTLNLSYGTMDTSFGEVLISWHEGNICFLGFDIPKRFQISEMKQCFVGATFQEDNNAAKNIISSIFNNSYEGNLLVKGSDFQIKVWNFLCKIPFGTTTSYQSVAENIGGKNYTRAAASAIAKNNISYLIPCHRVIRNSGNINQYRWGTSIKQKLLEHEKSVMTVNN